MDTCLALQKELAMDTPSVIALYTIAETRVEQLARSGAMSGGAKFRVRFGISSNIIQTIFIFRSTFIHIFGLQRCEEKKQGVTTHRPCPLNECVLVYL